VGYEFAKVIGGTFARNLNDIQQFLRRRPSLGTLCRLQRYGDVPVPAIISAERSRWRNDKMAHDRISPLTAKEMNALASRFEARAASVLLRDQPEMQSDMRLAARLINEWTGRTETAGDVPPRFGRIGQAEEA
jgi:hypothetical protein